MKVDYQMEAVSDLNQRRMVSQERLSGAAGLQLGGFSGLQLFDLRMPSGSFAGAVGDELVLVDVKLPSQENIARFRTVVDAVLRQNSDWIAVDAKCLAGPETAGAPPAEVSDTTFGDWLASAGAFLVDDSCDSGPAREIRVASFLGKVDYVTATFGGVTLMNEADGEYLRSRCDIEVLRENRLGCADEFRCEVVRRGGETVTRLVKLLPKEVSREMVERIREEFRGRWDF